MWPAVNEDVAAAVVHCRHANNESCGRVLVDNAALLWSFVTPETGGGESAVLWGRREQRPVAGYSLDASVNREISGAAGASPAAAAAVPGQGIGRRLHCWGVLCTWSPSRGPARPGGNSSPGSFHTQEVAAPSLTALPPHSPTTTPHHHYHNHSTTNKPPPQSP